MSYGVGCRHSSDPVLLWLWVWHSLAGVALIQPLAWEPPHISSMALKSKKKKKKKKKKKERKKSSLSLPLSLSEHEIHALKAWHARSHLAAGLRVKPSRVK